MPRKGNGMPFDGLEEIFSSVQKEAAGQTERVQQIPLSELHPFEGHPFRVVDDEEMQKTVESVKEYGVLTPAIARPDPDGGYEIISGHRRMRAAELAGLKTLPVIVRDMDDDNTLCRQSGVPKGTLFPLETHATKPSEVSLDSSCQ